MVRNSSSSSSSSSSNSNSSSIRSISKLLQLLTLAVALERHALGVQQILAQLVIAVKALALREKGGGECEQQLN